jgi:hypothetical protein
MSSIFTLLVAILLLGNLQFANGDAHDVSAYVSNPHVLDQVARLLGVSAEEPGQIFTNKTNYVRKELFTVLLNAENSGKQREQCVRDLYAILVAFVVETSNHRLAPAKEDLPSSQIILFDQPGFQTWSPAGTTSMSLSGTQAPSQLMVKMDSTNSASISRVRCFNPTSFAMRLKTRLGIMDIWSKILFLCPLYLLWTMELVSNFCEVLR